MSRARTLAGAIGSDGTLNVADVAGLAAVASSGSATDLTTGTLPIARIADGAVVNAKLGTDLDASKLTAGALPAGRLTAGVVPVPINFGDSGAAQKWMYVGQWTTAQMGRRIHLRFFGNAGFNADINQNSHVEAFFKTSNDSSSQTGSSGSYYADGYAMAYMAGSAGTSPSQIRVVQVSSTSYKFYANIGAYSGAGAYCAVDVSPDTTWTSSGTWADPSGNYIDLPYRNMLATTTTGSCSNQSDEFTIAINPNYQQSVVYVRARHDTGAANGYLAVLLDGSQVNMESNLYSLYRSTTAWTDTSTTNWQKLNPNSFTIDQGLDWGAVLVVRQRLNNRPSVLVDFQYCYSGVGSAKTTGSLQYSGSGGSITGIKFNFDCSGATPNMWADWQVVGIK